MSKWNVLDTINKDGVINNNKHIKEYIDSFIEVEDIIKCYKYLVVTGYNIKKVEVLMTLKSEEYASALLCLLDVPVFMLNYKYLKEELEESNNQLKVIKSYLELGTIETYNLDEEFIKGILRLKNADKVVKLIKREDFYLFENAFREMLKKEEKAGNIFTRDYRNVLAKKLSTLEQFELFKNKIRGYEYRKNSNQSEIRQITDQEFLLLINLCMENEEYRKNYEKLFILLNFESFKKEEKVFSKKYDLNNSHGRKRYNELVNFYKRREDTKKRLEETV